MSKKSVFYSFHFDNDCWRTQTLRNIGTIEGNGPVTANEWEEIKRRGDKAIENWIIESLKYKKCTIVLVGSETSNRKWVKREIELTWEAGKGLFGINIHNMKDKDGRQCRKGTNPFGKVNHSDGRTPLSSIVRLYDPPYSDSKDVYAYISDNIESWVDNAINLRAIY